ncbi:ABC transport system permease protein, putative [Mucilaginibacter xinganensis]|uniref:ABC transport system permease protein, putative n=1 Tax=Mucilaginibacter xinganensis TaxID=1234841 RepID=A0A223NRB8_9SPHI|nr:ABC transport system permease protein, putative [Mucilaginibacter xinganensis]
MAAMATLFSGFTLALLLAFAKRERQTANLFLSAALTVMVLKTGGLTPIFLPALGPLLYFYVRRMTAPNLQFNRKDVLHFCPSLVAYWMPGWLLLISVVIYLYLSHRLIQSFYSRLRPVLMDRPRFAFRRLDNTLHLLALLCLLWLFNDVFSFTVAFILIGMAAEVMLKLDSSTQLATPITDRYDAKEKSRRLMEAVAANRLYEDAELTLTSLAVKLKIHPHDLSRIINTGMEKNFSDFINEFRVRAIVGKMQDPAYDRLTLLGIAYESGFNSKTTFNRVFKEMTGKTPVEYKNSLNKEVPIDKLAPRLRILPVILRSDSPPNWAPGKLNRNYMLTNYLKIALRTLWRNKAFSAINIIGLALGLAICFLISLFVIDELSYDKFNLKADRIFRVNADFNVNGTQFNARTTPPSMASILVKEFPQIENAVRIKSNGKILVKKGKAKLSEDNCFYADNALFEVFTLPMIAGDPKSALSQSHSLVISENTARKYFNSTDVIGKTMHLDNATDYQITGVIENTPVQSHLHFDFIKSIIELPDRNFPDWSNVSYITYLLARPGVTQNSLDNYLQEATKKYAEPVLLRDLHSSLPELEKNGGHFRYLTIPLTKIHLHSTLTDEQEPSGNAEYVYIFTVIAILILLIACINFMNLSTAQSAGRAREVGVRKVLGSNRPQLIRQFLMESITTSFLAVVAAVILAILLLPYFNDLSGKQITLGWLTNIWFMPVLISITLVIGVISGLYPAFFLSAFQPIKVLKGKLAVGFKASMLRNCLVVFQFATVIILIIGTLVIYKQLKYISNKNLGYNRYQVLILKNTSALFPNAKSFLNDVIKMPGIKSGTMTSCLPTAVNNYTQVYGKEASLNKDQTRALATWSVDEDYIPTLGMQMADGRNFSKQILTDSSAVVINETAAKMLGYQKPLNKFLYGPGGVTFHIIGVVKDFNAGSLHSKISPLVLRNSLDNGAMAFRVETKNLPTLISEIRTLYHTKYANMADQPFSYSFMDEEFNHLYRSEQNIGRIFISFSFFSILIACLGLLGLVIYAAEQRIKEIGIRKVLGASITNLIMMLSNDFLKLIGISSLISFPVAWWGMNLWLQDFAYRTSISWWIFVAAGFLAVTIAMITVSYQALKAALANPIKSLRSE